jgi:hypothetical protein
VEARKTTVPRLRRRARNTVYFGAGMAASATLIAGSIAGLNVQVFGFSEWPLSRSGDALQSQVLPDPARGEVVTRIDDPEAPRAAIALPGTDAVIVPAGGQLAPGGTPLAGLVDDSGDEAERREARRPGSTETGPRPRVADSDGDGLSDDLERLLGTDPFRSDTDGDGIPDAYEVENRMDPRSRVDADHDLDGDGVSNRNEYVVKANPRMVDSNGDGIPDGDDDPDGDGIPNSVEQRLGLNPASSVTRAGAPAIDPPKAPTGSAKKPDKAAIEQAESKPTAEQAPAPPVADGDLDSDGDGFSNAAELAAGTDPADPASKPEPAPVDPPPVEPEPDPVDPGPVDPAPVDPDPVDPAPVDPPPVDPAPVDPAPPVEPETPPPVDPVPPPVEPAPVEPAPAEAAAAVPPPDPEVLAYLQALAAAAAAAPPASP